MVVLVDVMREDLLAVRWARGLVGVLVGRGRVGWGCAGDWGVGDVDEEVGVRAQGIGQGVRLAGLGARFGESVGGFVAPDAAVGADLAEIDTLWAGGGGANCWRNTRPRTIERNRIDVDT